MLNLYIHNKHDAMPSFIHLTQQNFFDCFSLEENGIPVLDRVEVFVMESFIESIDNMFIHNFNPSVRSLYARVLFKDGTQEYPTLNAWVLDRKSEKVETTAEKTSFLLYAFKKKYNLDAENPACLGFQLGEKAEIFSDKTSAF